jgi:hypothetical protein
MPARIDDASDSDSDTGRCAAARALGLDPSAIVWPNTCEDRATEQPAPSEAERVCLSDAEWALLAPLLPIEAPQAKAMSNRDFVNAVLEALRRGTWVSRRARAANIESVRRRFGRWSHQEVFQRMAAAVSRLDLPPETKRLLALAGQRAVRLKSRGCR